MLEGLSGLEDARAVKVIGAGLVGSLLASFLARRGYQVDVFERRPDMRTEEVAAWRSINLAISVRGIHALERLGIAERVLKQAMAMRGRMIHPVSGSTVVQLYGKDDSQCIYSVSRRALNEVLMNDAEQTGRVKIHFNERLESADLDNKVLKLVDERSHIAREVPYSRVFGTDGSASALRASLSQATDSEVRMDLLDYGYKEIVMGPVESPAPGATRYRMDPGYLHIWPRGQFMFIALPNFDGSFTCTLFLSYEGDPCFTTLKTEKEVLDFFTRYFPDALALIPDVGSQFFAHPTGHMVTIHADKWQMGGHALLLGDAAHGIVPFFGQGMNSGFEDCEELDAMLEEGGAMAEIFERFFLARKPNTDAIAELALDNFVEMRDRVGDPQFLLLKQVEKALHERFPELYVPRYALVTFSRVPYRLALDAGKAQDKILSELCKGLTKVDDIDYVLAEKLIRQHLTPLFKTPKEPS